jgi:hypothetical protein
MPTLLILIQWKYNVSRVVRLYYLRNNDKQKVCISWVWWSILIVPALGSLRQEDLKSEASLDYISKILFQKQISIYLVLMRLFLNTFDP